MEDAYGEESSQIEHAVNHVEGGKGCRDDVRSVPVLPGIGRFAVAVAGGRPPGIVVADTGVGEARTAPGEEGEEGLLFWGGLCDRSEEHVGCFVEGC